MPAYNRWYQSKECPSSSTIPRAFNEVIASNNTINNAGTLQHDGLVTGCAVEGFD